MLVEQGILGVHEHIKNVCRRYAKLNYYFGAPIPIPEPQTWALWLGGMGLLGWVVRRRRA